MALSRQVINFIWLSLVDNANYVSRIRDITIVQVEIDIVFVGVTIEMVDTPGIERGRTALYSVDGIALAKQELRQVCTVLTGNA
jgi:hypothetical protein